MSASAIREELARTGTPHGEIPSEPTIRSIVREAEETSADRWFFADPATGPEDARLAMELVAAAARGQLVGVTRRRGAPWPLSRSEAIHYVRVRRAFPELPLVEALLFARRYDRGEDARVIDDELALRVFGEEADR
jgi:hypothetical protein